MLDRRVSEELRVADASERPSSLQERPRGGLKGRKVRQPARGQPEEPWRASVTHLTASVLGPHDTRAPAPGRLPSSRLGTCGTAMTRLSSLPSFKRPANGGIGRREPAWARLRRGRREGRAVPSPRPPPARRTRSPAHVHARTHAQSCATGHYPCQLSPAVNPGSGSGHEGGCVESAEDLDQEVQFTYYTDTETTQATFIYTSSFSRSL